MNSKSITAVGSVEREHSEEPNPYQIGRWFWAKDEGGKDYLVCITHVGTNYVQVTGLGQGGHTWSQRIHLDEADKELRPEPHAKAVIDDKVRELRLETMRLMSEVHEITARLGVRPDGLLGEGEVQGTSTALAVLPDVDAPKKYKSELTVALKETLPQVFKKIEETNKLMAAWMSAAMIPLRAESEGLKAVMDGIDRRLFSVELYAGLCEHIECIRDGAPADLTTPVHLHQRRLYMDEECLVDYQAGGMEFRNLKEFDAWLLQDQNLSRILPHVRSIVAFRVRREDKEREFEDWRSFIRFALNEEARADRSTFIYVRNGEQVHRLKTGIDFDEQLFPDSSVEAAMLSGEKLYAKMFGSRVEHLIGEHQYRDMVQSDKDAKAKYKRRNEAAAAKRRELKAQGLKERDENWPETFEFEGEETYTRHDPFPPLRESESYRPYSHEDVYYDDMTQHVGDQLDRHNRVVLVLQGILDRSQILHPHPNWRLGTADGMSAGLVLVYDDSRAVTHGDKPDFEAYRRRLNLSLRVGAMTAGQDIVWMEYEADKENSRAERDWRRSANHFYLKRYRPYGNPGPGVVAEVQELTRTGKATFRWFREARDCYKLDIPCSIRADSSLLLNVSAYKPGDFRQFYNDPRTRQEYLQWAPLLLAAEDWHARQA